MTAPRPIVIAHRGACGYLPEHTLAAKAVAHAMEADFIEQDIVLTRDSVPIVLHDIVSKPGLSHARPVPAFGEKPPRIAVTRRRQAQQIRNRGGFNLHYTVACILRGI